MAFITMPRLGMTQNSSPDLSERDTWEHSLAWRQKSSTDDKIPYPQVPVIYN